MRTLTCVYSECLLKCVCVVNMVCVYSDDLFAKLTVYICVIVVSRLPEGRTRRIRNASMCLCSSSSSYPTQAA